MFNRLAFDTSNYVQRFFFFILNSSVRICKRKSSSLRELLQDICTFYNRITKTVISIKRLRDSTIVPSKHIILPSYVFAKKEKGNTT